MLEWTIEVARDSGCFERVVVSTEDDQIARLAIDSGATDVLGRSAGTASDHATIAQVVIEVLDLLGRDGQRFDVACCLFATAVFTTAEQLKRGRSSLENGNFDVVMSIAEYEAPIERALEMGADGHLVQRWPEFSEARSQDLPHAYYDTGQWYWFRTQAVVAERTFRPRKLGGVIVPSSHVQDIDTPEDWTHAEIKHAMLFADDATPLIASGDGSE